MKKCVCEELKEDSMATLDLEEVEVFGKDFTVMIGIDADGNRLYVGVGEWFTEGKPIKFCPMCGRNLWEE